MNDTTKQDQLVQDYKDKIRNPMTAIRAFCVSCMGGYIGEIKGCTATKCALYPLRTGKNPYHTRKEKEQDHG